MFAKPEIDAAIRDALSAFGRGYDEVSPKGPSLRLGEALGTWAERVALWNQRVDLTAARSVAELVDLLLADALALASFEGHGLPGSSLGLRKGALEMNAAASPRRWVDVGSGAGAPGLALALLLPELELTLVEPKSKRVAFLRGTLGALARPEVRVERCTSRELLGGGGSGQGWDVAVSRATLEPPLWRSEGLRIAKRVWVLLARRELSDEPGLSKVAELDYQWPLTGAVRHAVAYERSG